MRKQLGQYRVRSALDTSAPRTSTRIRLCPCRPPLSRRGHWERANRRWGEILQETRVAQTGGQILFGCC
ncbi:hypothetical protein E6U81_38340 [Streptomyces sp. A0592]|nr:hypothetical protein E6U81_38340 [Streptomyces sp. A0592]